MSLRVEFRRRLTTRTANPVPSGIVSGILPLGDDTDAIARVLWQLTDQGIRPKASAAFVRVKTTQAGAVGREDDKSPDFSQETPQKRIEGSTAKVSFDQNAWAGEIRRISAGFLKHHDVYESIVFLQAGTNRSYLATSEGTALEQPSAMTRLLIQGESRADDGMDLLRVETFQAASPGELPPEAELAAKVEKISADLEALRAAPEAEPYAGPALLSGRAAAVFFHEVPGPPPRGPPKPARRARGPDVHQENQSAGAAAVSHRGG